MSAAFDPLRLLRVLSEAGVQFIVVGGFAGRTWGSPTITNDLDVCYSRSRDNLVRLAAALRILEARLRGAPAGLPFQLDEKTLAFGDSFTFETNAGALDCLGTPSGTKGYDDLAVRARAFELPEGLVVRFTALEDLMRMKRAAGRPKDLIELEILAAVQEELEKRGSEM
jgi:hypothetical protein